MLRTPFTFCVLAFLGFCVIALGGCSSQTGQYAPIKQQWDTPHSDQLEDSLRNRLEHTQHDH